MFIRKTKTGQLADGSASITYRLVENQRIGTKVKQKTLLNLGRHFKIKKEDWSLLCQRIKELMDTSPQLFDFEPVAPNIEAEARRVVTLLLERQEQEAPKPATTWDVVDTETATTSDARTIGVEHAAMAALAMLGLPPLLNELGFTTRQKGCALASIIGRMTAPGSERKTSKWLRTRSAVGEMLGLDFGMINDMALHRAADKLWANHRRIEDHLFASCQTLFDIVPTISLYDLTNTYFEGTAQKHPKAHRGKSKEKRYDAPLLTLGLVLDGNGFVRRSTVLPGNVSEPSTMQAILNSLGAPLGSIVIMDRGIASADNLAWLRAKGYRYLVVSREQARMFEDHRVEAEITTAAKGKVRVYSETVTRKEKNRKKDKGKPRQTYQEVLLRCYSEDRAAKEMGILARFETKLEEGLRDLDAKLSDKGTRKGLDYIHRKIGRLLQENGRVAKYYAIKVEADDKGQKATAISWTHTPKPGSMKCHPGVYTLRTTLLDWEAEALWRTYSSLTDVEGVFRSLKSELGLRPIYHHKESRSEGHLFISVLAFQAVQLLRRRLNGAEYTASWETLREELGLLRRMTTKYARKDGGSLHVRKTENPNEIQEVIYKKMGIPPPPRNVRKTYID